MARSLSYADAARILGGQDSKVVTALEKTAGWLMAGTAPFVGDVLGWFDYKADLVRLSHDLVRGLSERKSGLSRYDRTERLEAALTVIAVASFFEALDEADLPSRFTDLQPTKAEQLTLAGSGGTVPESGLGWMVEALRSIAEWQPSPQQSPEDYLAALRRRYTAMIDVLHRFLSGLAGWESLDETGRARFLTALRATPQRACERYDESFRQLVAEFPEVACWAGQREHRSTRAALADTRAALAGLEEILLSISTGRAPGDRRRSLDAANRAELSRRVAESGDVPDGIRMPTLGQAYVPPRFRAADVAAASMISEESWWSGRPAREDLQDFLVGHLTSPQAVRAPLLVLGQPGSGKSVLTRVLGARLPPADFMPVRVVLRDAPVTGDLQDQIEHAFRRSTGERADWPELSRAAGDALPVIMLDGFDELLQAVGVSQTDYLVKVARFQQREAEQGRPVAVIVTTRTAVADRARAPEQTVAVRLEPFDDERVATWLAIWNEVNTGNFTARGLDPLPAATVLAHPVLAEQPLLLLMLALYDADGNALQRSGADLRADELYERLLRSFAIREITKHHPGLSERELAAAVETELRRLSVVAFAMFNRAALWVTEADLGLDLAALPFGSPPRRAPDPDLRAPLEAAELTLGRFFFIHRARALRDDNRIQTYEFLHATFAEYFVARLTWQVIRDVAAREAASILSFDAAPADDELLRALLSFQPLCLRAPVVDFLQALASSAPAGVRDDVRQVALRLFRTVNHTPPGTRYAGYLPMTASEPGRYATYAANLLLLALCTGPVRARELYPEQDDPVDPWHAQALLWRSQLSVDGWTSLVATIDLDRLWENDRRDLGLELASAPPTMPVVDIRWTFEIEPTGPDQYSQHPDLNPLEVHRKAYFQCGVLDDMAHHALEPFAHDPITHFNNFAEAAGSTDQALVSPAHLFAKLFVRPSPSDYSTATTIAAANVLTRGADADTVGLDACSRVMKLTLNRLCTDETATAQDCADFLEMFINADLVLRPLRNDVLRCLLHFYGRDSEADEKIAAVLDEILQQSVRELDAVLITDALVRVFEKSKLRSLPTELADPAERNALLEKVAPIRPDLVGRFERMVEALDGPGH
ncbi:NACHT domain-containing protein [Actinoplanes utahensis]|uniref:NACHT domain-containing protein n=1 Tax=Actinoplanes utahensis TaxID=1869 RepID=UPI0006908B68|nr:hypothetical protein [Actinoplanes utahensis]GIF31977.1 hypothetical protein Aut01nite_49630 [Actinoplanes utahensis]